MGSTILFLLIFLSFSSTSVSVSMSDKLAMTTLIAAVTPTPSGWSSAMNFCSWRGVKCDRKNRVISIMLAAQSLSGTLPMSLNSLSHITTLCLQANNFYGALPSLANLYRLRKLHLHNNSFNSIPISAFSGLINLRLLSLSDNTKLLPWPFPSELIDSTKLTAFYAGNANIIGSIPNIFRSFPYLVNLTLSNNNLTGLLPISFIGSSIHNLKVDNQKSGLTGNIDVVTGMNHLSLVWVQGNLFTGVVPPSLIYLSNVRLENNQFQGPIPHFSRKMRVDFGTIALKSFQINDDNAASVPPPKTSSLGKKTNVGAVVGYTFLLVFGVVVVFVCIYCCRSASQEPTQQQVAVQLRVPTREENIPQRQVARRVGREEGRQQPLQPLQVNVERQHEKGKEEIQPLYKENVGVLQGKKEQARKEEVGGERAKVRDGKQHQQVVKEQGDSSGLPEYTYRYLKKVTNNFDLKNKIGKGGFGNVYKGFLYDGNRDIEVAVKCLKFGGKIDDFKNEVDALGRANHSNLVKLIGYCAEGIIRILVYEYMINGSLDKWIFQDNPRGTLTWPEMKNIIQGIAQGLVYLHKNCEKTVLHRDLKPQNVVLDKNKNAKLCDFGIAKLLNKDQSSTSTACAGTPGYMAPEVMRNERITDKVDVYSFGVVVLEVMFGKRYKYLVSTNQHNNASAVNLPNLIKNLSEDMRRNGKEIEKIGMIAMSCLREYPEKRPTMSDILAGLP